MSHQLGLWTTCVPLVSSPYKLVKGLFLSCSVALVARTGVRCTACVGTHERVISDYGAKFPQITTEMFYDIYS